MSLNYKKISEFFGVEKKFFSESELESESEKKIFRSRSRVSESKNVTPLITNLSLIHFNIILRFCFNNIT
jgi:hypothetical protein